MKKDFYFREAQPGDWAGIEALLRAAALPLEGAREHLANFIVGEANGALYCVAGFEHYERIALLRSVAVSAAMRGKGVGDQLLDAVKSRAMEQGVDTLYLLTTTAAGFFGQRGFTRIERTDTAAALQASREFQGICPASATAMVANLHM